MTFRVGQKVVCINDKFPFVENFEYPKASTIYHVREIVVASDGAVCIRLVEIINPSNGICGITGDECEPRFLASRFRPVVESKTEISFTHGADPSSDKLDNRRKVRVRA